MIGLAGIHICQLRCHLRKVNHFDQATIYFAQGMKDEAHEVFQEAVETADNAFFNFFLGWSHYHNNRYSEALKYFERVNQLEDFPLSINTAYLSNTQYRLGNMEMSEHYRNGMIQLQQQGLANRNLSRAMIHAARGERELTISWLERAFENRDNAMTWYLNLDPLFSDYLEEPRIRSIREEMQYFD